MQNYDFSNYIQNKFKVYKTLDEIEKNKSEKKLKQEDWQSIKDVFENLKEVHEHQNDRTFGEKVSNFFEKVICILLGTYLGYAEVKTKFDRVNSKIIKLASQQNITVKQKTLEHTKSTPTRSLDAHKLLENKLLAVEKVGDLFKSVHSGKLETIQTSGNSQLVSREDFFKLEKSDQDYKASPPILSKSSFVSEKFVEHLMKNKKNTALGVKYKNGDKITNMEGALHTFLTPLAKINLTGDYAWKGYHSANVFGKNQVRPVILSAAIQPDFEDDSVMAALTAIGEESVEGAPLPDNFKILSEDDKNNAVKREAYDKELRKHMIYHLTASHRLPARKEIAKENILRSNEAQVLLEKAITSDNVSEIKGKYLLVKGELLSLEVLLNSYIYQLSNEFSVLEKATPQGYVYTIDPPSIFAKSIGGATLLNRLQILAFKKLGKANLFNNLKIIGFNNYADKEGLALLKKALPNTQVMSKNKALQNIGNQVLVIHNNSDAFGQNIEFEGPTSMDGIIGNYSDAALVLKRSREDLTNTIV